MALLVALGLTAAFYAIVKTVLAFILPFPVMLAGLFAVYLASYAVLLVKLGEFDEDDYGLLHGAKNKAKSVFYGIIERI